MKKRFTIKGMHCNSCAFNIEQELEDKGKGAKARVDFASEKADIEFDETKISEKEIKKIINNLGYEAK